MNRFIAVLIVFLALISSAFAFDLEKEMFLSQHVLSYTTSYDISSQDKRLGTIYRRVLSLTTKYDFYDTQKKLISSAEAHFFSFGAHFDIYDDTEKNILGTVEEKVIAFFPTFDLYATDGTHLGQAKQNFWGTTFTLYSDKNHTHVLAVMSRKWYAWKNDWAITITDMERVKAKHIDPRFLMTVLAIEGDLEDIVILSSNLSQSIHTPPLVQSMQTKLNHFIQQEEPLSTTAPMTQESLDALANHLDESYQKLYANTALSAAAEAEQFVDYCLNEARAPGTTLTTKKAIVNLLQKRIKTLVHHKKPLT
ncbi:MAG: hypothetical protein NXI01_04940 [Gammaproteobacteria bacterium]|nr:hypothetical protein [Gammaproteobacteria bacterium]